MAKNIIIIYCLLVLSGIFIYQINSSIKIISLLTSKTDEASFLTELSESGLLSNSFDINDPFLKSRSIHITSYFNEHLTHNVLSRLEYLDQMSNDTIHVYLSSNGGWIEHFFGRLYQYIIIFNNSR